MNIGYIDVTRVCKTEDGTFGALSLSVNNKEYKPFCVTLEPEDKNNQVGISCIPADTYICERYSSIKYPDTWEVKDVEGRTHILLHAGNTEEATRGCIVLAAYFGKLYGKYAVLNSGATFRRFMIALKECDVLHLTITDAL